MFNLSNVILSLLMLLACEGWVPVPLVHVGRINPAPELAPSALFSRRAITLRAQEPTGGKTLVIVESPAKAKKIQTFLPGDGYIVDFCLGHVRDLLKQRDIPKAEKERDPDCRMGIRVLDNFQPMYAEIATKAPIVERLKAELAECSRLILATDEDREGEAISWHLLEVLDPPASVAVERASFNEITKAAIEASFASPRDIDQNLVAAQVPAVGALPLLAPARVAQGGGTV